MRRRLITALKVCVSAGLLGYVGWAAVQRDGIEVLWARLGSLDVLFLTGAIALHFVAVGLGVARYRMLLEARGLWLPVAWLSRSYLIGRFVGAFTPSTMGLDLYRTVDVARRTGERARSGAVIVTEKLYGLLGLSFCTLALLPLGTAELLGPSAAPMALLVLGGALVGLYALRRPAILRRITTRLPAPVSARVGTRFLNLADALEGGALSTRRALLAITLSMATHLTTAAVFAATGLALGLHLSQGVSPASLLVVGNAIVIATLLPISIGGVGVREGVAVVLLAAVAVGPTDASLVALLGYLTGQMPALVGGLLSISRSAETRAAQPAPPTQPAAAL